MARKKRRLERRHHVSCSMKVLELNKAGSSIRFVISSRDGRLGEIVLGRGSIAWRGGHKWTGKTWRWSRFAEIMNGIISGEIGPRP
ncbi:MAG: hypothetical protein ABR964_04830 [Tepidisphaeraceae bacterium]